MNTSTPITIKPTVGRVVWFYPYANSGEAGFDPTSDGEPLAAIIARVWSDRMVNLTVFDASGKPHSRTSVELVQDAGPGRAASGGFCTWMPFQKGQAKAQEKQAESIASTVLYPAIRNAMEELGALHPSFNDHVNRAWNHLHRAFWSEAPAPASAPGLRDTLAPEEARIVLSDELNNA